LDSELRLTRLERQTEGFACEAASCAIELGKLEKAVEFLELGRSLFWGQATELRTDTVKLRQQNATLANRLEQLGKILDQESFGEILSPMEATNPSYEVEHVHRLAEQWDEVVHEIRQVKEFEDFLLPTPYEKLREAAAFGPVIILNVSRFRCDAVVIASTGPITAVSLPDFKAEDVKHNATDLQTKLNLFSNGKLHASELDNLTLRPILAWVWRSIGIPLMPHIEHAIASSNTSHRHVWWYPTGYLTFVPIHAAGLYEGEKVMADIVISSYTMNLTSLYRARRKSPREDFRFAVVGATVDDESQRPLPMVADALRNVELLKSTLPFESPPALEGSAASVDAVISEMQKSDWVHFSCHGHQDIHDPMESHLVLHDGPLSVSRIASNELSHIELVHLAACHTASGMAAYSDESFHIAAAFQFTGAKGVLATMWAIHDEDGAVVTEKIYGHLLRKNRPRRRPDAGEAARALNRAVRHLRRSGASESLHRWVPFVHIGV
jgi:CHAT domain-containing protein